MSVKIIYCTFASTYGPPREFNNICKTYAAIRQWTDGGTFIEIMCVCFCSSIHYSYIISDCE